MQTRTSSNQSIVGKRQKLTPPDDDFMTCLEFRHALESMMLRQLDSVSVFFDELAAEARASRDQWNRDTNPEYAIDTGRWMSWCNDINQRINIIIPGYLTQIEECVRKIFVMKEHARSYCNTNYAMKCTGLFAKYCLEVIDWINGQMATHRGREHVNSIQWNTQYRKLWGIYCDDTNPGVYEKEIMGFISWGRGMQDNDAVIATSDQERWEGMKGELLEKIQKSLADDFPGHHLDELKKRMAEFDESVKNQGGRKRTIDDKFPELSLDSDDGKINHSVKKPKVIG